MKKLFMMAFAVVATTSAFAGDSEPLKAILKAPNYEEAVRLVEANLGQLANDEEKAKAYNKLVDLALVKYDKESAIIDKNMLAAQLKQGDQTPYDTVGFYNAAYNALQAALECDKYDQLPNLKGKVKPKYASSNKDRLVMPRLQLINGGQEAIQVMDLPAVLKYWGTFLDTEDAPLFASVDKSNEKDYFGQVAITTARVAYQSNDLERCKKYCEMAMRDPEQAKDALNLKLYISQQALQNKADSVNFVNELKEMYAQDSANDDVFNMLFNMYGGLGEKQAQLDLVDGKLAQDPNHYAALFNKALLRMNADDADGAIDLLRRTVAVKSDDALAYTYLGACLHVKGSNAATAAEGKPFYKEAVECLDKAKELDPNMERAKWGYNRFQAYYGYYGPNDPRTKEAEAESH